MMIAILRAANSDAHAVARDAAPGALIVASPAGIDCRHKTSFEVFWTHRASVRPRNQNKHLTCVVAFIDISEEPCHLPCLSVFVDFQVAFAMNIASFALRETGQTSFTAKLLGLPSIRF